MDYRKSKNFLGLKLEANPVLFSPEKEGNPAFL